MWLVITFILGGICGIFGMALLNISNESYIKKQYLKLKNDYYKLQLDYDKLLKKLRYYKGVAARYNQLMGFKDNNN